MLTSKLTSRPVKRDFQQFDLITMTFRHTTLAVVSLLVDMTLPSRQVGSVGTAVAEELTSRITT